MYPPLLRRLRGLVTQTRVQRGFDSVNQSDGYRCSFALDLFITESEYLGSRGFGKTCVRNRCRLEGSGHRHGHWGCWLGRRLHIREGGRMCSLKGERTSLGVLGRTCTMETLRRALLDDPCFALALGRHHSMTILQFLFARAVFHGSRKHPRKHTIHPSQISICTLGRFGRHWNWRGGQRWQRQKFIVTVLLPGYERR